MQPATNQRLASRIDRRAFDIWQATINNDELITRHITNISPGGMAFKAPARVNFNLGQVIKVLMRLTAEKIFECEGRVVWVKDGTYGVHFFNCPISYDIFVMKTIHEFEIGIHADELGQVTKSRNYLHDLRQENREAQRKRIVASVLDLALVGVVAAAFIVVAVVHERRNPQSSLERIFTSSFEKLFSMKQKQ